MFGQRFLDKIGTRLLAKYQKKKFKIKKRVLELKSGIRVFVRQLKQEVLLSREKSCCGQKGVLLCADSLMTNGGIEKRLCQYSRIWRDLGYRVYYAARNGNKRPDLWFTGNSFYNDGLLLRFCRKHCIRVVEWNAGGGRKPWLTFKKLQKKYKIGVVLHASNPQWNYDYLQWTDYVICSHHAHGKRVPALRKYPVLPNAVEYQAPCWTFCHQRKALLVSRLGGDKGPSLEGFIKLCFRWNISFYIAGDFLERESAAIKNFLQKKYGLADSVFLGRIDTTSFLKKFCNEILFVGGLGQVILEAGQLNYPCLLCSLLGEEGSFFVNKSNLNLVLEYNCSPHSLAENTLLKNGQNIDVCFKQIIKGKTEFFQLGSSINAACKLEGCLKQYIEVIQKIIKNTPR